MAGRVPGPHPPCPSAAALRGTREGHPSVQAGRAHSHALACRSVSLGTNCSPMSASSTGCRLHARQVCGLLQCGRLDYGSQLLQRHMRLHQSGDGLLCVASNHHQRPPSASPCLGCAAWPAPSPAHDVQLRWLLLSHQQRPAVPRVASHSRQAVQAVQSGKGLDHSPEGSIALPKVGQQLQPGRLACRRQLLARELQLLQRILNRCRVVAQHLRQPPEVAGESQAILLCIQHGWMCTPTQQAQPGRGRRQGAGMRKSRVLPAQANPQHTSQKRPRPKP